MGARRQRRGGRAALIALVRKGGRSRQRLYLAASPASPLPQRLFSRLPRNLCMALQLTFGEASATGPRSENQDAIRVVTPAPALAASKGYLFAIADGVSQCADGGLAARATLQALALDYYSTPETCAAGVLPWRTSVIAGPTAG